MRKLFTLIFVLWLAGCQMQNTPVPSITAVATENHTPEPIPVTPGTQSAPEIPHSTIFTYDWNDPEPFLPGLAPSAQESLNILADATVYHMNLSVSEDLSRVTGQVEVRYENRESVPLDEIRFHLFPNILGGKMDVTAIKVNGKDVAPGYALERSILLVPLEPRLEIGGQVVVSMSFSTLVPDKVEVSYGVLANAEGVLAYAHGYPMIAVYNSEGWNTELPPQYGDITFNDACFYIVRIELPGELVVAVTGNEIAHSEADGRRAIVFAAGPARDFNFAASKHFVLLSETANGVTVNSYAPDAYEKSSRLAIETAIRALEIFSERYTPYPYTELDIVTTPNLALGIEYPGLIAMTDRIMEPEPKMGTAQASIYIESVMAHEVGHQWFYNLVGNDQLDEPWLDESLSQFVTLQYYLDVYGERGASGYRQSLQDRWWNIKNEKIPIGMPVQDYSDEEYGAIVYGRGGLFFEALRDEMGQADFDAFMKDYTETFSWEIATSEGLKSIAEKHCSCKLTPLFTKWIYAK